MPPPTRATLAGLTLLGSSPVQWALTEGTTPYTTVVDMVPSQAETLLGALSGGSNKPLELMIDVGGTEQRFKGIYAVGRVPAATPHVVRIALADRRVWWRYFHIGPRRYNWRRRVGFKRLRDPATPDVIEDVQGDIWYAPWSLFDDDPEGDSDPRPWTGLEILENVYETIKAREEEFNGNSAEVFFDDEPSKELPVENLLLDGPASDSLARALGSLPEMGLFIDQNGNVRFYSKASGKEEGVYEHAGSEKVGGGHVDRIQNVLSRPKEIRVLFTREVEVRFDFEEAAELPKADPTATTTGDEQGTEFRGMLNVLPNPDFISQSGKPAGSWMSFDEALAEWNKEEVPGFGKINYPLIRKAMVPFMDLWSGILNLGQADPDIDWGARINALQTNYRKTFQVNQRWWSRILSVHAYRVAIIDKETGSRAPAAIWAHFCRMGTMRSFFRDLKAGVDLSYLMNTKSYPDKVNDDPDFAVAYPVKKFPQADARVAISDPDQGVIHIDFLADENSMYEMCLPSLCGVPPFDDNGVPVDQGPTSNPKDRNRPLTFDAISDKMANGNFKGVPQLAPSHRVAIILTAIPAAWNKAEGKGGPAEDTGDILHPIVIKNTNGDLRKVVTPSVAASLDDASGPTMEVRIGAGVEVARVAWVDERSEDIEKLFGIREGEGKANLEGLVVNEGETSDKGASLNQIALAVAASIYSSMADHLQGSMTGTFLPDLRPAGWLDEISHEVATSGEGSTKIDFPESLPRIDLMSYLDASTRATIMKLAQPGI